MLPPCGAASVAQESTREDSRDDQQNHEIKYSPGARGAGEPLNLSEKREREGGIRSPACRTIWEGQNTVEVGALASALVCVLVLHPHRVRIIIVFHTTRVQGEQEHESGVLACARILCNTDGVQTYVMSCIHKNEGQSMSEQRLIYLDRNTSEADIDAALAAPPEIIRQIRKLETT